MATGAKHWNLVLRPHHSSSFILSLHSDITSGVHSSVTMRLTGSRAYARPAPTPTMPPGLVELMEGLTKDVLKNNPENVYEFCASHMQKLLEIRDDAPPKKQLSLGQKIAKAQEKLRQKNKNRRFLHDRNLVQHPYHGNLDQEAIIEITEDATAIQPVIGKELITKREIEEDLKSDLIIAANDSSPDYPFNVVNEVVNDSQVEHDASIINVTYAHETEQSSEKMVEEVIKNNSVDTNEPHDVQAGKPEFVAESKATIGLDIKRTDSTDHMGIEPSIEDDTAVQHNESGPTVSDTDKKHVEEKTDSLNDEAPENKVVRNELNKVATTLLLGSQVEFSNVINEFKATEKEVEEPKIVTKEGNTDTHSDEMSLEKIVDEVAPDKKMDNVIEKQNTTSKEEPTNIQHQDQEANYIESKECGGEANVDGVDILEENDDRLLSKCDNSADHIVGKLNIGKIETPLQTENTQGENPLLPSTNSETEGAESNLVTTEITFVNDSLKNKDDTDDHNVHNNEVNYEPQADKGLTDVDYELPEQRRAHSEEIVVKNNSDNEGDTTITIKKDSISASHELPENTAVSGMDLETAAITIQKVFRSFLFSKSRASTLDDTVNENSLDEDIEKKVEPEYTLTSASINKERRTLGISRMDTVLQTVNEEKSLSLSDDSSLSSAATTIQAHVRGFLVRNRLASNKTASNSSLVNSDGLSTSLDGDVNEPKKTILNIHIVPERGQFMSRDESLLTSIDLPLDNSPPSSINLHPLGYDKSERRKQLKREDAVQSISPPSNNSGKQSEEMDSVKETLNDREDIGAKQEHEVISVNDHDKPQEADSESCDTTLTISSTAETVIDADSYNPREVLSSPEHNLELDHKNQEVVTSSDEMDVVTPPTVSAKTASVDNENDDKPKLVHSGEFHDIVVQTRVKRSEASVVSEFKNVLVYFLVWDKA